MTSPGENAFNQAEQQQNEQDKARELLDQRGNLTGNIEAFLDAQLNRETVQIPNYEASDGHALDVDITAKNVGSSNTTHVHSIQINGKLHNDRLAVQMPMYKINKVQVFSDGGTNQPIYEILAADPDQETGYKPLALIEQEILGSNTSGTTNLRVYGRPSRDMKDSHTQLSPLDMQELKKTGIWVDPRGQDMLAEVQDILGQTLSQEQAAA